MIDSSVCACVCVCAPQVAQLVDSCGQMLGRVEAGAEPLERRPVTRRFIGYQFDGFHLIESETFFGRNFS